MSSSKEEEVVEWWDHRERGGHLDQWGWLEILDLPDQKDKLDL
jgi:hypothetical protein